MFKWDMRFLLMAQMVSQWSKDPSTKCGAVITRPDHSVVSVGFNGFPMSCDDRDELYSDRDQKYRRVVHAETNAIILARQSVVGFTLYSWPPSIGPSCERCSTNIIQAGITRVVHAHELPTDRADFSNRWSQSCLLGLELYKEAGVEIVQIPVTQLNE